MKYIKISLLSILLTICCVATKAQVLTSDSLALVALYNATNGPGWTAKTNWLTGPVSSWYGITVSGGRVTSIDLFNNLLSGTIPAELGNLTNLTNLVLSENLLLGALPVDIGNMISLQSLYLGQNQFTGTIPSQLVNIPGLRVINMDDNNFSGSIPSEIGNIITLEVFTISRNQLSGTIPASLGNLTELTQLWVDNNQLTGAVPSSLANLSNPGLQFFYISNNNLTDLPDLSALNIVGVFSISDNKFTFEDIEPNLGIPGIVYTPQKIILAIPNQNLVIGDPLTISYSGVGGSANQYQWMKDGITISGATSNTFSIPAVSVNDAGSYELFITSPLVSNLTLQTEPFILTVGAAPQAIIEVKEDGTSKPNGEDVVFSTTGIGNDRLKDLEIINSGNTQLIITDIQVTGDYNLLSAIPSPIDPGTSTLLSLRFAPTSLGERVGTLTILSNSDVDVFTINLTGEGEVEPEVYNVVTANQNGKHDFLNIKNITFFPQNKVSIFDRWGNKVFERDGYDNAQIVFAGISDDNITLPDGTYFYVIDKNNGDKPLNGFLYLRR